MMQWLRDRGRKHANTVSEGIILYQEAALATCAPMPVSIDGWSWWFSKAERAIYEGCFVYDHTSSGSGTVVAANTYLVYCSI